MNKFLFWLTSKLPARLINGPDGEPYLERYYMCTVLGWRFYIHRFVGDDPDRGLHDHPWLRAFSILLVGWYIEQRRHGYNVVRWFNWLTGDSFHRVILPSRRPVWTLFGHKVGDVKEWGFLTQRNCTSFSNNFDEGRFFCEQVFTPYAYKNEGGKKPADWWKTAPRGADITRAEP